MPFFVSKRARGDGELVEDAVGVHDPERERLRVRLECRHAEADVELQAVASAARKREAAAERLGAGREAVLPAAPVEAVRDAVVVGVGAGRVEAGRELAGEREAVLVGVGLALALRASPKYQRS